MYHKEIKTMFEIMDKYPAIGVAARVLVLIVIAGIAFCLFAYGVSFFK